MGVAVPSISMLCLSNSWAPQFWFLLSLDFSFFDSDSKGRTEIDSVRMNLEFYWGGVPPSDSAV